MRGLQRADGGHRRRRELTKACLRGRGRCALVARMLKRIMRPALPLVLSANSCFRELLKADAALWDQHRPLRLLEELRPYAPGGDEYEAPILSKGCSENVSERFRGVSLRGGVLRGDHPLKRMAFVLKLCALLSSETSRTLYLDLDVFVLSADLAMELLTSLSSSPTWPCPAQYPRDTSWSSQQ